MKATFTFLAILLVSEIISSNASSFDKVGKLDAFQNAEGIENADFGLKSVKVSEKRTLDEEAKRSKRDVCRKFSEKYY